MKYYRKSITLILALLLMTLFGACSGKKNKTETNVTTDSHVTVEQNTTTGTGDNNTTVGGTDDNATTGGDNDNNTTSGGGSNDNTTTDGNDDNPTAGGGDDNATTGGNNDNNTTTGGGTDDNVTTGGNDDNATTGGGDGNTTTTPTVTLKSLNLTVDKTSLNKDENITVKVMATYSDNASKEVTGKVEWVAVPNNTIKVTNTTLTALQDKTTTLKAKLKGKISNAIDLNITWVVNGHTLPPEPDKAVNDATLLGIDTNNNGVRDDVERWIYDRYKDSHPVMIPLKMQAARAYQKVTVDPKKAYETTKYIDDAQNCAWAFTSLWANAFGRKPLVLIEPEDAIKEDKEMEYVQYNTTQRARAYGNYNQTLSGGVFELEDPSEKWIENCDFNTTKFIEMSEKL